MNSQHTPAFRSYPQRLSCAIEGLGQNLDVEVCVHHSVRRELALPSLQKIKDNFDHRFLENGKDLFKDQPATLETITRAMFRLVEPELGSQLLSVQATEGDGLSVEQSREGAQIAFPFALNGMYLSAPKPVLGTYSARLILSGPLDVKGWIVDRTSVREWLHEHVVSRLDQKPWDKILKHRNGIEALCHQIVEEFRKGPHSHLKARLEMWHPDGDFFATGQVSR